MAARAMEVAAQQVQAHRLLSHALAQLPLPDLLALAWLCGAIDTIQALPADVAP